VSMKVDMFHVSKGDPATGWIVTPNEGCSHAQAGGCLGGTDVVEYGVVAVERPTCPVLANLAEEPVLDGVPFRGARRIVAHGDGECEVVGELCLQEVLPRSQA